MPAELILGQASGRARRWPGQIDAGDDEGLLLAIARRLDARDGQFLAECRAAWDDQRSATVAILEKLRALEEAAQADLDRVVEQVAVVRRRASEAYFRLLPKEPDGAAEVRSVVRAMSADERRSWIFGQRQAMEKGDRDAAGRLASVLADPAGELVSGPEKTKLLQTLLAATDRTRFETLRRIERCLATLDGWLDDNRSFYARTTGLSTKEAFFRTLEETKRRAQYRFGPTAAA